MQKGGHAATIQQHKADRDPDQRPDGGFGFQKLAQIGQLDAVDTGQLTPRTAGQSRQIQ